MFQTTTAFCDFLFKKQFIAVIVRKETIFQIRLSYSILDDGTGPSAPTDILVLMNNHRMSLCTTNTTVQLKRTPEHEINYLLLIHDLIIRIGIIYLLQEHMCKHAGDRLLGTYI